MTLSPAGDRVTTTCIQLPYTQVRSNRVRTSPGCRPANRSRARSSSMRVFSRMRRHCRMRFQRRNVHHSCPTNSRSAINTAQRLAGSTLSSRATRRMRAAVLLLPWCGRIDQTSGMTAPPSMAPRTRLFRGV